jgi:hypothetical protein
MLSPRLNLEIPSPFHPPDCHFLIVEELLRDGCKPLPNDDPVTREFWAFLRSLRKCRNAVERRDVRRQHRSLAKAYRFHKKAAPLKVAEVQARILAGETDEAIAAKCSLTASSVAIYHHLFFEVRPRLQATGYILNVVLGEKFHSGLSLEDRELVLKYMAFIRGSRAVDDIIEFYRALPLLPGPLKQLDLAELKRLRKRFLVKNMLLALTFPSDISHSMIQRLQELPSLEPIAAPEPLPLPSVQSLVEQAVLAAAANDAAVKKLAVGGDDGQTAGSRGGQATAAA